MCAKYFRTKLMNNSKVCGISFIVTKYPPYEWTEEMGFSLGTRLTLTERNVDIWHRACSQWQ